LSHYDILGVDPEASEQEIKAAYRKLVKQYHPDKNDSDEARQQIVLVNAAYEILSDPEKRIEYDSFSASVFTEATESEEYRQAYREAYILEKKKKARVAKRNKLKLERLAFRVFRVLTFPILIFAIVLIVDHFLPGVKYTEVPIQGWQKVTHSKSGYESVYSFMQTKNFEFEVPNEVHLNYPYYEDVEKPSVTVETTPLFKTITRVTMGTTRMPDNNKDVFSNWIPLPWLLLLSSLFTVMIRKYALASYSMYFLPAMLLTIIIMQMKYG